MNFVIIILTLQIALTLCDSLISTAVMFPIIAVLGVFYMKKIGNKQLQCQNNGFVYSYAKPYNVFVFSFLIILGLTLIYWLAYYPGGFNLDASGQWEQAHGTFYYDDWHPILSTLLIQFSISVCDFYVFYIFVQIVCFSLSVAVLLYQLNTFGVTKTALVICAVVIGINPAIALNTISMTKDAQFTIFLVVMFCFIINLYFTQGSWLCKWHNTIFFSIVGAIPSFFFKKQFCENCNCVCFM